MKFLVTGGAGFVGGVTAALALERGHDVLVVDPRVPRGRTPFVPARMGSREALEAARSFGPQAVLHFAATSAVETCEADPEGALDNNVCQLARLVAALRVPVVNSSSSSVYGDSGPEPVDEGARREPVSWYGWTKLAAEGLLDRAGVPRVSLRYGNVAGAAHGIGDRNDHIIPSILRAVASGAEILLNGTDYPTLDGTCVRDYVHVLDVADAHLAAAERLVLMGSFGPLNVGTGRGTSVLEVVRTVERATGQPARVRAGPRRPGDPAGIVVSIGRIREHLGWSPTRTLDDCVNDAWAAMKGRQ